MDGYLIVDWQAATHIHINSDRSHTSIQPTNQSKKDTMRKRYRREGGAKAYERYFLFLAVFMYGLSTHSEAASSWSTVPSLIWYTAESE